MVARAPMHRGDLPDFDRDAPIKRRERVMTDFLDESDFQGKYDFSFS